MIIINGLPSGEVDDTILDAINSGFALTGDSVVANVLTTKTFYKDDITTKLTGTMPNNAGDVAAVSSHSGGAGTIHVVPATGYTDGADDASVITDADFVATNIKHEVNIFGIAGTYDTEAGAPIAAETVLVDKVGFVNGTKITGTMVNNAGDTACTSSSIDGTTLKLLATVGYRDGVDDNVTLTDADFIAANIKDGVTIFGLLGTYVP
jgi:hypothetical protein